MLKRFYKVLFCSLSLGFVFTVQSMESHDPALAKVLRLTAAHNSLTGAACRVLNPKGPCSVKATQVPCPHCGVYYSKSSLGSHDCTSDVYIHPPRYVCLSCEKAFASQRGWSKHAK